MRYFNLLVNSIIASGLTLSLVGSVLFWSFWKRRIVLIIHL